MNKKMKNLKKSELEFVDYSQLHKQRVTKRSSLGGNDSNGPSPNKIAREHAD